MPTELVQVQHVNLAQPCLRVDWNPPCWSGGNGRLIGSLYFAKAARANPALSIAITQSSLRGHKQRILCFTHVCCVGALGERPGGTNIFPLVFRKRSIRRFSRCVRAFGGGGGGGGEGVL